MLFYLSSGDATKIKDLRKVSLKYLYNFLYQKRLQKLNELLNNIAHLEKLKRQSNG